MKCYAVVHDGTTGPVYGAEHEMQVGRLPGTNLYVESLHETEGRAVEAKEDIENGKEEYERISEEQYDNGWPDDGFAETRITVVEFKDE